jgi:hypothetical protein
LAAPQPVRHAAVGQADHGSRPFLLKADEGDFRISARTVCYGPKDLAAFVHCVRRQRGAERVLDDALGDGGNLGRQALTLFAESEKHGPLVSRVTSTILRPTDYSSLR